MKKEYSTVPPSMVGMETYGFYLYNIYYPVNPEAYNGKSHDYITVLKEIRDMGEY